MRAIKSLKIGCLALLFNSIFATSKHQVSDIFQEYHVKSLASTPLRLDDTSYNRLTSTPRNHSVAILLTAQEARFGCNLCRDFHPEWELIGKSWIRGDRGGSFRVLFGTLDFANGKETFQKVMHANLTKSAIQSLILS